MYELEFLKTVHKSKKGELDIQTKLTIRKECPFCDVDVRDSVGDVFGDGDGDDDRHGMTVAEYMKRRKLNDLED